MHDRKTYSEVNEPIHVIKKWWIHTPEVIETEVQSLYCV